MRTLLLPLGVAVCLLHPAFLFADTSMGPPIAIEPTGDAIGAHSRRTEQPADQLNGVVAIPGVIGFVGRLLQNCDDAEAGKPIAIALILFAIGQKSGRQQHPGQRRPTLGDLFAIVAGTDDGEINVGAVDIGLEVNANRRKWPRLAHIKR